MASSLEKLVAAPPEQAHIDVTWRSFELRPKDAPPISPEYRARIEAARPQLYATAREQYGIEMNPGPFGIDSRPALIGAKAAEAQGVGPAYQAAVMRAYWLDAQDISHRDVLADIAVVVGLDRDEFLAALATTEFVEQVDGDIELARRYGLSGVPALVFDHQYLVSGAQPLPVLIDVVERILAERNREDAP